MEFLKLKNNRLSKKCQLEFIPYLVSTFDNPKVILWLLYHFIICKWYVCESVANGFIFVIRLKNTITINKYINEKLKWVLLKNKINNKIPKMNIGNVKNLKGITRFKIKARKVKKKNT